MTLATCSRSSTASASDGSLSGAQDDEGEDRLAGHVVLLADDRRLGDRLVVDQRRLDLGRRDPVAGDVHHVVDAAEEPEVAVEVLLRAVAREVHPREPAPVRLLVPLRVAVDAAQHRRPRPLEDEDSRRRRSARCCRRRRRRPRRCPGTGTWHSPVSSSVTPGSGVIMIWPVSVCHQVSTIGRAVAADVLVVPQPRLGVDRLADRAEQPQRREVVACRERLALLHEGADRGRGAVQDRDLVVLDDLPPAIPGRRVGRALVQDAGRRVGERPVDDVAVAGDPADVGGAPVDVVGLDVEHHLVAVRRAQEIARGRVQDALRLGGRARGVEQVEHVLRVDRDGRAVLGLAVDDVVPPVVATLGHGHGVAGPAHDDGGSMVGVSRSASSAWGLSATALPRR